MKDFKISWQNLIYQSQEYDIIRADSEAEAIQKFNESINSNDNESIYNLQVNEM